MHSAVPHFAWPFRFSGPHSVTVEQDTDEDVVMCLQILLQTERNSRIELPDYGIASPLFRDRISRNELMASVVEWEPRIRGRIFSEVDSEDPLVREVMLMVRSAREGE